MLDDRVLALARDFNPWWEGRGIEVPDYKRHLFAKVQKFTEKRQIIAVVGLRRVGKTVLMRQIIRDLLEKGEKKENVFYFLFDELSVQKPEALEDLLNYYLKTIAGKGKKHVFLDEIQKVPFWQDVVKRFYDTRNDVKFFVSGSSSLQIAKSKESLAGRMFDFFMPVLSFREFLEMNGIKAEKTELGFESFKGYYEGMLHKKPLLEKMLLEDLFRGAFPETAREKDEEIVKKYVQGSVIDKIIFEDIPLVFNVRRKDVLNSVLEYCSRETSSLLDITSLSKTLGVNYHTVKSYLFYLKNSFVLDLVFNYSKSTAKKLRKSKKVHIAHPSVSMASARHSMETLSLGEFSGKYIETAAFLHAKVLCDSVYFWRTPQKEEVDLVLLIGKKLFPVEVKFKPQIPKGDLKAVSKFLQKFKQSKGIVVTKDLLGKRSVNGGNIWLVPAWLFLLAV